MFNSFTYGKIFKTFTPVTVRYYFLDIFHICLTVIPDFTNIYWRHWYTGVNLTNDNITVTFIKDWDINSFEIIFWLAQNKKSMHDIELFITRIVLSVICLYPADNVRELIFWLDELVISFCHHLEQRAL